MAKDVKGLMQFEIGQIDELFAQYAALLMAAQEAEPELVELTALASVLHSFFTGVENIFAAIARNIDGDIPIGVSSHRDLLNRMVRPTAERQAVLSSKSAESLAKHLAFRHFYRHSYSFHLDWDEMKELVIGMPQVWQQVRSEILSFLESLDVVQE